MYHFNKLAKYSCIEFVLWNSWCDTVKWELPIVVCPFAEMLTLWSELMPSLAIAANYFIVYISKPPNCTSAREFPIHTTCHGPLKGCGRKIIY